MLVSILVANYNNGVFFKDCYDSIVAQTYAPWECIIVDDASNDNSVNLIKELIKDDEHFHLYINDENKGCGFTKNKCVTLASGDICGFLDPDDALYATALQEMAEAHAQATEAALVYANFEMLDASLQKRVSAIDHKVQVRNQDLYFCNKGGQIGHFATFKRKKYAETAGINPFLKRAVDQDLYLKLYEVGEALLLDKVLYKYRVHNKGISTLGNEHRARYWYWVVLSDVAQRRNIDFEEKFCNDLIWKGDCWVKTEEVKKNPSLLLKKGLLALRNRIVKKGKQ